MKKALALFLVLGVLFLFAPNAFAVKSEPVEKAGVVEVQKADPAKKEKYDTVLLKIGEESFKLIPGNDKKALKTLETLGGKNVVVKGDLLPANPPKYPLAAIKVNSFEEKAAEAAAPAVVPAPVAPDAPAAPAVAPADAPKTGEEKGK